MLGPGCPVIIDSDIYDASDYHDNTESQSQWHKRLFVQVDLDVTGKQAAEEWISIKLV
jgi:hypothetical protein